MQKAADVVSHHVIDVTVPYRLDLTISVLRRLSGNVVDVLTPDGRYMRALDSSHEPVVVCVTQKRPGALSVKLEGVKSGHARALGLVRRVLGVDRNLTHFNRAAAAVPWLRTLARRMRGVKPPRYPSLWEACVNAVVFQQLSLSAASAILRRMIVAFSPRLTVSGVTLHAFPSMESVQGAKQSTLSAFGLSANKLATLRRVADTLQSGALDEAMLEERTSPDAISLLCRIKGIGPWTATVILLRGLGRLDVFPMNDSSVTRNLAFVAGSAPPHIDRVLNSLGPQRGMLYYHLLLARLHARGDIGRASIY